MLKIYEDEKGAVLVTGLLVLLVLSVIGTIAINTTVTDTKISGNVKEIKQAYYLAEAGISHGIEYVDQNRSKDNWDSWDTKTTLITKEENKEKLGWDDACYEVTIEDAGDNRRRVVSTGTSSTGIQSQIEVILDLHPDIWDAALHGCDGVEIQSSADTSSYSSSGAPTLGNMGDIATSHEGADVRLLKRSQIRGSVRSNGTLTMQGFSEVYHDVKANGSITLEDAFVHEDAISDDKISLEGRSWVFGEVKEDVSPDPVPENPCDPLDLDHVFTTQAEPIKTTNDNSGLDPAYYNSGDDSYEIGASDTDTIGAAGTASQYYFSSFEASSNASVTLRGDVTIYVDGDFQLQDTSTVTFDTDASLTLYVPKDELDLTPC